MSRHACVECDAKTMPGVTLCNLCVGPHYDDNEDDE